MRIEIFCAVLAAALAAGCTSQHRAMGGAGSDLEGRPVIVFYQKGGVPVAASDLPPPVTDRLRQQAPAAQISTIDKENWNGRTVYVIRFVDKTQYPTLCVADDGALVQRVPR